MPKRLDQEELTIVRNTIAKLARERLGPLTQEIDERQEFPWQVPEKFKENELLGLMFLEEFGGSEAPLMATVIAVEEVAQRNPKKRHCPQFDRAALRRVAYRRSCHKGT